MIAAIRATAPCFHLQGRTTLTPCCTRSFGQHMSAGIPCYSEKLPAFLQLQRARYVDAPRSMKAHVRAEVRASLETHLRQEPDKTSRSRIKKLRGLRRPQYRLRVGDIRVFYDLSGTTVEVLAIVAKSEAESWLAQFANPE